MPTEWATRIREGARGDNDALIIDAINRSVVNHRANNGSVMLACAQILAQTIVNAPPDIAREVRQGIISLIDDYAMRVALEKK